MTIEARRHPSRLLRWAFLLILLWAVIAGLLTANSVIANRSSQLEDQQSEFITSCTGRGGTDKLNPDTDELTCEKGARRPKLFEFEPDYNGRSLPGYVAHSFLITLSFGLLDPST